MDRHVIKPIGPTLAFNKFFSGQKYEMQNKHNFTTPTPPRPIPPCPTPPPDTFPISKFLHSDSNNMALY